MPSILILPLYEGNLTGPPYKAVKALAGSAFCILAICQRFDWVQYVQNLPDWDIAIIIVPNRAISTGNGRWHLLPDDGGTRPFFDVDLTLKHRIPPVIAPWLVERKLSEDAF